MTGDLQFKPKEFPHSSRFGSLQVDGRGSLIILLNRDSLPQMHEVESVILPQTACTEPFSD
ncbi:hypothetical protein KIN20_025473 [Parelaphostrongylus tenuis]|uniref:Uncharacterized protein n=1 Tax=Parelaphostrongylus tenuis TaxID=148309 RepID=A0AAD5NDD5_PARTN|nr:hypothetical protein KIN20_025473 [Parelaphostrongylus tenuis]